MIAFLTLCYCLLIWVIFFKLKLAKFDFKAKVGVTTIGVVGIGALLIFMNLFQPFCPSAVIVQFTVPIVPEVSGPVIEVPAKANVPLAKGDVILKIDPVLYQAQVDRLEALLAEAEQNVPQLKATLDAAVAQRDYLKVDLVRLEEAIKTSAVSQDDVDRARYQLRAAEADAEKARLAYASEIKGENTTVARYKAELTAAKVNLGYCTYEAPADGYVTNLFLKPGTRAVSLPLSPVGTFIYSGKIRMAAAFEPNALRYVRLGDDAEIVLDSYPGSVFQAKVKEIVPMTAEGQLAPSGNLRESTSFQDTGQLLVILELDEELPGPAPPVGTGGAAAIYTERMKPIRVVRKVVLRIQAWLGYL